MRRESPITHGGDTKVILTLVFLHTEGLLKRSTKVLLSDFAREWDQLIGQHLPTMVQGSDIHVSTSMHCIVWSSSAIALWSECQNLSVHSSSTETNQFLIWTMFFSYGSLRNFFFSQPCTGVASS
jgi:hypothetical protein